jgi:ribosomal protein S20
MRNSARKQLHNRSVATRLHSLEKKYVLSIAAGKKDDATKDFQSVVSAWDKAAKTGAVPKSRANRKKSRLAVQLARLK